MAYRINENGLHMLLNTLELSDTRPCCDDTSDAVFVAIDFENPNSIKRRISSGCSQRRIYSEVSSQVGLAILDTKHLHERRLGLAAGSCDNNLETSSMEDELITTVNFATGFSAYCEKAANDFLFGKSICINREDMREKIESCIPQNRKIILVGHGMDNDLRALEALEFNFEAYTFLSIIDTFWIAHQVFPSEEFTLNRLLCKLRCPYQALHCAGNDANFTLRALILLATVACENIQQKEETVKFLAKTATTSSYSLGPIPQETAESIKERLNKKKERKKRERLERMEKKEKKRINKEEKRKKRMERLERKCFQNITKYAQYRAQRAAIAELQSGNLVLEEGDLSWLEVLWHAPRTDLADSQSQDYDMKIGDLNLVMM